MKRKPDIQPGALERFRRKIVEIMNKYPVDHIVNMNETSWKLLNYGE
jgi:septum formation topological specificity factor MinE